jgi:glycosyltransferase involved in cell wall biosynthesis
VNGVAVRTNLQAKSMRVHYLVTSLEKGGAEFAIPNIVREIRTLSADLHVYVFEPRDRLAEPRLIDAGIPYTMLSDRNASKLGSLRRYLAVVRASRPDLIWTSLSHATFVGQMAGALCHIPVVSWKHSADSKWYIRRFQRLSKLWIADSEDVGRYLRENLGVDDRRVATWPLFTPSAPPAPMPRWTGAGPLRIGSAGRLTPQKNYDLLVRSIDRLRSEDPETFSRIQVSVAGDGPRRDELQRLIDSLNLQDHFRLVGWVDDISDYLRGLHLYIQPSAYEGMCIAAHEAMAAGLPIIATPVGELRRSVQSGITGMLIEGDTVAGTATAIGHFVKHPAALQACGERARDYVERSMGRGAFSQAANRVFEQIRSDVLPTLLKPTPVPR